MKTCCHFLISLLVTAKVVAQEADLPPVVGLPKEHRAKAIYLEALGGGGLGLSLHYDMRFRRSNNGWGWRVGYSQPVPDGRYKTYSVPIGVNRLGGAGRVAGEVGVGAVLAYTTWTFDDDNNVTQHKNRLETPLIANVGVRFRPLRTGAVLRLSWSPTWTIGSYSQVNLAWVGASLGVGFK